MLLRQALVIQAYESKNPQDVYAFAALEKLFANQNSGDAIQEMPTEIPEITSAQDAIDALNRALSVQLARMTQQPGAIDLKRIREVQGCMALVKQIESEYAPKDGKAAKKQIDDELLKRIKEEIYGIA